MQIGMIGLGRMGGNMTKRLEEHGHEVKTYDPKVPSTAKTLEELRDQLERPRTFWMMVPAGKITEETFQTLVGIADEGDVIVDGGNSNFHDSKRRYDEAKEHGVRFVDAGVSGGVWGLEVGYCLMVGGDDEAVAQVESTASSLEELAAQLDKPRSVWLMIPAAIVDRVVAELAPHLEDGDTIVDGGNSYYVDDLRRQHELRDTGIHYVDVGVSGGVWGL
ncbi:MAG: NAD(P)-binding domain-containing protein, partial [Gaiellaceae bacterium]